MLYEFHKTYEKTRIDKIVIILEEYLSDSLKCNGVFIDAPGIIYPKKFPNLLKYMIIGRYFFFISIFSSSSTLISRLLFSQI